MTKDKPQDSVINREAELPSYLNELLSGWLSRADNIPTDRTCENYFQPFIYLWIAFNSYLMNVAGEDIGDQERDLIYAAAHDARMNEKFNDFYINNSEFGTILDEFSNLWPIFKVKDLVRESINSWQHIVPMKVGNHIGIKYSNIIAKRKKKKKLVLSQGALKTIVMNSHHSGFSVGNEEYRLDVNRL